MSSKYHKDGGYVKSLTNIGDLTNIGSNLFLGYRIRWISVKNGYKKPKFL